MLSFLQRCAVRSLIGGKGVNLSVDLDREEDGRWIAEVATLPGVLAYGDTREQALAAAEALALRVLAERLEQGEQAPEAFSVSFLAA
jgi:predicted RNase H-like HicB family nuclease